MLVAKLRVWDAVPLDRPFSTPRGHLGLFVGEFAPGSPATVTLRAYDVNNQLVGETKAALTPGTGFHTPLVLESKSANIARFVAFAQHAVGVDDFAFS